MKEAFLFSVVSFISRILIAFTSLVLAKILDVKVYGLLTKILSVSSFLALTFSIGIPDYTVVNFKKGKISYAISFYTLVLICSVLFLSSLFFDRSCLFSLGILKTFFEMNILTIFIYYLIGKSEYLFASLLSFFRGLFFVLSAIFAYAFSKSLYALFLANVLFLFIGFLFFFIKENEFFLCPKFKFFDFREVLPFSLSPILGYIYTQGVVLVLTLMSSSEVVGNFFIAYSVVLLVLTICNGLYQYFLPKLCDGKKYLKDYFLLTVIVSFTFFVLMKTVGFKILELLYASDYSFFRELNILVYIILIQPFSYFFAAILTSTGFQKFRVYILLVTNVVFLFISYFLIKFHGSLGAAYASLTSSIITFILYAVVLVYLRKRRLL